MCGICGFTGIQNQTALEVMTKKLFHRGPDEWGFYSDGNISMGMRRLSIIDLKSGKQPVHNENKNIWAVFNGEIYNFRMLRKDLEKKGHKFYTSHSDTEVIVHLYEEYGDDFPNYINGMFAIALWDKDNERLLLIRDRMGVKPLFYNLASGNIVFASEIKSILSHPGYVKDISYEGIYHYLSFKNVPAPLTAFKNIISLMPGELLVYKNGSVKSKRYWKIKFAENYNHREEEIKEKLISILEDSVRIRMISDVPFGAYLSGGVDSSTVVAFMSKYHHGPVKTFSLGYEDELKNKEADLYYARKVSMAFNTDHHEYIMSARELLDDIDNVIMAFDQPFSGTISTYFLSKLIKKHVKVALSGDGADELFGSYLAHRLAQPMLHFARLYDKYKGGSLNQEDLYLLEPYAADLNYLQGLYEKSGGNFAKWRYHLLVFSDLEKPNILTEKFLSCLNSDISTFSLVEKYFKDGTTTDPLNSILEVDWNSLLPDQVLAFVDFLSMAHSVEVRSPFLDYRLVEFISTVPGFLKIKRGIVKHILKESVKDMLPDGITERPKEGFVLPVFFWMMDHLKTYTEQLLSKERIKRHGYLDFDKVRQLHLAYYGGRRDLAAKLWNIMMFQKWWELYFD